MTGDYAQADGVRKSSIVLIGICMAAAVLVMLVEANLLKVTSQLAAGTAGPAEAQAHDDLATPVYLLYLLVYIVSAILFLVWINRSNKNLHAMGMTDMQFSPGWAVGWWFVPFANLVKGHTIVKELWEGSNSPTLQVADAKKAPKLLDYWWGAWLISGILGRISARIIEGDSPTLGNFRASAYLGILSAISSIIAGYLVIQIIKAISEAQAAKRQQLRREAHASAPPPPVQDLGIPGA